MASHCSTHHLLILALLCSCLLVVHSFSLAKEDELLGPFNAIYNLGDIGDSSSSSAADHIAATLNLPSPQPHTQHGTEFFESGLNFATPGATIMSPFFFLKNGIKPPPHSHDLTQIVTFMKFFYKDCFSFHDCGKNKVLRKALIFMDQPGINDYKQAFLNGKSISEASHLVPEVVETIKNSVERLIIEAEAKTIMVSGILPMGCFPVFRTLFPESDSMGKNRCHKGLNLFSKLHNDHLSQAIMELRLKYPEVHIIYADYYKAFMAVLKNHAFLGFKTKTLMKACCGSGDGPFNFDAKKKCGEKGAATCSKRASYLHWDGFRLTPEALENLIDTLFSKKGFVFPEFKFGEETAAAVTRHHSRIHGGVRNMSSIVRHLLFV
ncbi:GDSL esterase/lipase At5g03980-like [Lycium ferocissimum]|uniref:GDSL esterase/lipase At5g03980-like n=1 Tax=Lycium ferocissimum TaxID=112874 RepID=UPI0028166020|nr:GDSL esterase/lipase At5g03980-like [Lycium ferocissimum]